MAREGGKYEVKDGEAVLVERTGWKPEKKAPKQKEARKGTGKT